MNQPELGKKILELRKSKGLTQKELAENCNISLRTIQRIEAFEVTPRDFTSKKLLSYLGFDAVNTFKNPVFENQKQDSFKNFLELFNLKKNTMKKLSVLSLGAVVITLGLFLTTNEVKAQKVKGWFLTGSNPKSYTIGLDKVTYKTNNSSAFITSKKNAVKGFGTLMQSCSATNYLGKRVKMTAYIKTENVSDWTGMWLRVDSNQKKAINFDNMEKRALTNDNDWTKCEIVLDIPAESARLNYGVLLNGTGKVWFDNIQFEIVDPAVVESTNKSVANLNPSNLNFSN